MSKLSNRVNKLYLKTHVFVTVKDFSLIISYVKDLLEKENAKPEDFQKEYEELKKAEAEYVKDKSINFKEKITEIIKGNRLISAACIYFDIMKTMEKFPTGCWISKSQAYGELKLIQQAKEYFNKK